MKRMLKKCLTGCLAGLLMLYSVTPVYANENNVSNLYQENYVESASIDGDDYSFEYYYDNEGNRNIAIKNIDAGTVDIVTARDDQNDDAVSVYVNGRQLMTMSLSDDQADTNSVNNSMEENQARSDWMFIGADSLNWTQSYANTTTIVAAGIAVALGPALGWAGLAGGLVTAAGVAAAMGQAQLSIYVNKYVNGVIYAALYQQTSWGQTTLRLDWSILFENRLSPDYSLYIPVSVMASEPENN